LRFLKKEALARVVKASLCAEELIMNFWKDCTFDGWDWEVRALGNELPVSFLWRKFRSLKFY